MGKKREVPLLQLEHEGGAQHRTEPSEIMSPRVITCAAQKEADEPG